MQRPKLVIITFADDPERVFMEDHARWMVGSGWLQTVGAEYGIRTGTFVGAVRLTQNAPLMVTDSEIKTLIAQGLTDGTIPRGTDGGVSDVLYMLQFPRQTTVWQGAMNAGPRSCTDFGGYHGSVRQMGLEFPYAVVNDCPTPSAFVTQREIREFFAAHEFIEAAASPYPITDPAFVVLDRGGGWNVLGVEIADMCETPVLPNLVREGPYVGARVWSGAIASTLSSDPCIPAPNGPYFNTVITPSERVRARPGARVHYTLTGWSTGRVADWTVATGIITSPSSTTLPTTTMSGTVLNNGRSVSLDVQIPGDMALGTNIRMLIFSSHSGSDTRVLPVYIRIAASCETATSCDVCARSPDCGWCAGSGRCLSRGTSGSADGQCTGDAWLPSPGSCPGFCAAHNADCADCAAQPGCGWCSSGTGVHCLPLGGNGSRSADGTCTGASWSLVPSYCP